MKNPWFRAICAVLIAEAIPIVLLVGMVALMGLGGAGDESFAEWHGQWVGPVFGALATFGLAYWTVRPLTKGWRVRGALVGFLVAALDATIVLALGSPLSWLFVLSWSGRIVAGFLAGALARRVGGANG